MDAGTRYALGLWFTCDQEMRYRDGDEPAAVERFGELPLAAPILPTSPPPIPPRRGASWQEAGKREWRVGGGLDDDASTEEMLVAYTVALHAYDETHGSPDELLAAVKTHLHGESDLEKIVESSGGAADERCRAGSTERYASDSPDHGEREGGGHTAAPAGEAADAAGRPVQERIDCGFPGIGRDECIGTRGCLWNDTAMHAPWCYFP